MMVMRHQKEPDKYSIGLAWQEPALLQIGKSGLSEGVVKEAKRLLKSHEYVKLRLLRSARAQADSQKEILKSLCEETGATLIGTRGHTGLIYKSRK